MAHTEETLHINVLPPDRAKIKKLWMTALILLVITILEFIVAFTVPHEYKDLRVWIFITMTIVKAGYIVGEFMHLRYEVKVLIWSILIPMIFIVWMLVAFIYEGMAISAVR
ncbi:cytochrome C oxidase subunit IV family protein [Ohtaekwangia koreensis]|jgi:cytochrome c oxidase subunit 4|uniref:Cytochrome C oxidase subunit IV n=1 Tax=Ohtaekwangia koreensis TaxID=688867 RepID=A0A1T5MDQ1_9BACT|nr:cytochrome C oxidase subunit IV family protein [Ohtaekwangia koreensis]SKC86275.1 Cytochrome C oxidase subunit IV [Ohtaekwangia koreensis]